MWIFFLNFGCYYNAVLYRHKYLNRQPISEKRSLCFIVYTTASPAGASMSNVGIKNVYSVCLAGLTYQALM